MSEPHPLPRRRPLRLAAAFAVLLALIGYVLAQYLTGAKGSPSCEVADGGGRYRFDPEQASNAAVIAAVGTTRGMPERAVTIALATALQESGLRNIDYGDRDSLGLFQQRPSQGWGTERQIMDPVYASGEFYEHLDEVPGYSRMPLTVAAQRVQRSGFPQAYAKHEPDAALLAAALTGRTPASLTCDRGAEAVPAGDPAKVRAELRRAFGPAVLPKAGTGAVLSVPAAPAAGGASGAPDTEPSAPGSRRGWELAHWAVARAHSLGIAEVSYAGRVWTAERSSEGWRTVTARPGPDGSTDTVRITAAPAR
ncbi:hypothetical protein [Streptomyces lichenis]|uniref:ARB-07466-like C-terminal domain-containing protein n=1 Tax=Streptomyces lichenis TaxID=2306967 RepID=A0ABT0IEY0_9ACTN|nr:hypothetical protein [Streptomyces lichenis]MCK8679845.1 hypothetical protein [Streptomyces lichenis]